MDEPTNHLDVKSITWLENFLLDFEGTVIVVSHDRHFLNKVCTHMADIDFGRFNFMFGNYDFWYESSQLALQMAKDQIKRKKKKLKNFNLLLLDLVLMRQKLSRLLVEKNNWINLHLKILDLLQEDILLLDLNQKEKQEMIY